MRLIVHGCQEFARTVLEALLDDPRDEVVAVYCAVDDAAHDPLVTCARDAGIPVYQPSTYKDPGLWEQIAGHNADLGVMVNVTLFVPEEALNAPRLGSIQYHPSLLPHHRGRSAVNWPIIMGEKTTGVSVFWPDNGLDTGPVLAREPCEILPNDTAGSLVQRELNPRGLRTLRESITLVRKGEAPKISQNPNAGSYEVRCTRDHSLIDWSQPAQEVYNLVRGCDPSPGAWSTLNGYEVTFLNCARGGAVNELPGTLVGVNNTSVVVALNQGSLLVSRVQVDDGPVMSAQQWFRSDASIVAGTLFDSF